MKLTYWCAAVRNDSPCYNVRAKTRRAALAELERRFPGTWRTEYAPPVKVSIRYRDAFDLLCLCRSEGGGYWEPSAYDS